MGIESIDVEHMIAFRHDLHANPEVGLDLPRTQGKVLEALDGLGLEITTGNNSSSVMAVLRGGDRKARADGTVPTVLMRGDMDALPLQEETGLPFASTNENMHACGHDTHTSMLMASARALAADKASLPGDVVFMFQPGEEGVNGAQVMIDENLLDVAGQVPDAAMGLHSRSNLGLGVFSGKHGAQMASGGSLYVTINGKGGHGSAPHQTKDPIPALLASVLALEVGITREFDVFSPIVLTVGSIHAGTRRNIIPGSGSFEATIRTFDQATHDQVWEFAPRVVKGVADAFGVQADIRLEDGYPALINNDDEFDRGLDIIKDLYGEDAIEIVKHAGGGTEDFARVLQRMPGYFLMLGACPPGTNPADAAPNHSGFATFDDDVMRIGAGLEVEWVNRRLRAATM